jgi:hypothetical protein
MAFKRALENLFPFHSAAALYGVITSGLYASGSHAKWEVVIGAAEEVGFSAYGEWQRV